MRSFLTFTLALALAVVQPVLSVPAITSPVASTSASGGKLLTVAYSDNGNSPKLSTWKGVNIFLATGDVNTQYKLQELATNISVHKTSGKYVVDSNIGPDGGFYFIRMESVATNSSTGIPYMAFSSKFTLKNMTGTFNSTVQAAASSGSVGSSSSSSGAAVTTKASSSSSYSLTANTATSTSAGSTATGGSAAATSGANSMFAANAQQSLMFFGAASAAIAGIVVLL